MSPRRESSRLSFAPRECAKSLHKNGSATRSSPTCGGGPASSYYGYNVFKRLRMILWGMGGWGEQFVRGGLKFTAAASRQAICARYATLRQ